MLQAEVILAEKEKVASLFKDGYFFCEVFKSDSDVAECKNLPRGLWTFLLCFLSRLAGALRKYALGKHQRLLDLGFIVTEKERNTEQTNSTVVWSPFLLTF